MKNCEIDLQRWSQHQGGRDLWGKWSALWGWGTACAEQLTPFAGISQRVTNTNHREAYFIPSTSHVRTTHCPTLAKMLFLRIIYSQEFFSGIVSGGFFFFLIDHAKNNPSGKDVVWLSEKAAPSPSKFCYQCLWGTNQHRGLLLAFDHLTFVKPPKTLSKVW